MELWQQLIVIAVSLIGGGIAGALVGTWIQRRTIRDERAFRQKTELCNAMHGLLMEIEENLVLAKIDPIGMRLLFPTDMWEVHKGKVGALPLTLQESLYKAYSSIRRINTITQTALAYAHRYHIGDFDKRYLDEVREANGPLCKAREELAKWLVEMGCGKPRSG